MTRIAFNGAGLCTFDNEFARNFIIVGVDNNFTCHADTQKNNMLLRSEGPTDDDNNNSVDTAEKKFSINFTKANTKFVLSLHYNGDGSYLYVNKTGFQV